MYVLGIDGGGTKTVGSIVNDDGTIIDTRIVGPTNPNSLGFDRAEKEMTKLITELHSHNHNEFSDIKAVYAGMSGVGREKEKERMTKFFSRLFPSNCSIEITNDAINALYSGTFGKPGIVNISGTGSITLAIDESNTIYRVGGYGFLLEDGSGYTIGRDALVKVFAEYDGYGDKTSITEKFLSFLDIQTPSDLISIIYENGKSRTVISSLTIKVFEAAREGDEVANAILKKTGEEMATSICRLIKKLPKSMVNQNFVNIVLTGSIYRQADLFLPIISNRLINAGVTAKIIIPELPPVTGSIFAALKIAGIEISDSIVQQIKKTWEK